MKILIVYYSHSGNTGEIASLIQAQTNGILFEAEPDVPYPVNYNEVVKLAKKDIEAGKKPLLKSKINNIESYDIIFI